MKWEVRTMRSATSYFNPTVFRKTFLRFWPLWAANLVFWLFVLPLNGLVQLTNYIRSGREGKSFLRFVCNIGDYGTIAAVVFSICAGLLVAMAVYSLCTTTAPPISWHPSPSAVRGCSSALIWRA